MPSPNHNNPELSVLDLAANTLLTLIDKTDTVIIATFSISSFEIMTELEKCFKVRYRAIVDDVLTYLEQIPENEVLSHIGDEQYYTILEKSIIADLAAMQWLFTRSLTQSAQMGTDATGQTNIYLKKAEAGSASVEYGLIEPKNVPFIQSATSMMSILKSSAERKAKTIGCIIDICDDCTVNAMMQNPQNFVNPNFVIVRSGCSC